MVNCFKVTKVIDTIGKKTFSLQINKYQNMFSYRYVYSDTFIFPFSPVVSVLLVRLTVFPNRQYRGILCPMTPVTTSPVCIPIVICRNQSFALIMSIPSTLIWAYFILQNNVESSYKNHKNCREKLQVYITDKIKTFTKSVF